VLKLIFFVVLALVGTRESKNERVQIFRPTLLFWGYIPVDTPRIVDAPMSVIIRPLFVMLDYFIGFSVSQDDLLHFESD